MNENKMYLLAEQFYEWMQACGRSITTRKSYRIYLNKFLNYLKEQQIDNINQVIPANLYRYQTYLYYLRTNQDKPLSTLTQHNALCTVRSFFRFLVDTDRLTYDPSARLQLPKKPQTLPVGLNLEEMIKILDQPNEKTLVGFRDRTILEVLYVTGMRNRELRFLEIYDVDLDQMQLRIRFGKGGKERMVPVGTIAANYIHEYLIRIRPRLVRDQAQKTLFLSRTGRQIDATDLIMMVRKHAEKAAIKKRITPHILRHTCATHLLKNGADIRYIQMLLGHDSVLSTQIYTKVEVTDLKEVHARCHPREASLI